MFRWPGALPIYKNKNMCLGDRVPHRVCRAGHSFGEVTTECREGVCLHIQTPQCSRELHQNMPGKHDHIMSTSNSNLRQSIYSII